MFLYHFDTLMLKIIFFLRKKTRDTFKSKTIFEK
jgi:hypothetical protein